MRKSGTRPGNPAEKTAEVNAQVGSMHVPASYGRAEVSLLPLCTTGEQGYTADALLDRICGYLGAARKWRDRGAERRHSREAMRKQWSDGGMLAGRPQHNRWCRRQPSARRWVVLVSEMHWPVGVCVILRMRCCCCCCCRRRCEERVAGRNRNGPKRSTMRG